MRAYFGLLALGLSLLGCATDRSSGGTAETENAATARYYRVDSLLAASTRRQEGATVVTLRLDSANFGFPASGESALGLDVRTAEGRGIPFEMAQWEPSREQARLRVRIDSSLVGRAASIAVWRGLPTENRVDVRSVWAGIGDSLREELTSVLVDDFEGGTTRTRLPDSSSWFLVSSTNGTGLASAGKGRTGTALRLVLSDVKSDPVALAAALLASAPKSLRTIDSIVFRARGKGAARCAVERAGAGGQKVAWSPIDLDSAWRRIRIVPSSFDSVSRVATGERWEAVRDSVTHLSFWMVGAGELWIDDPRIFGIDKDDLR